MKILNVTNITSFFVLLMLIAGTGCSDEGLTSLAGVDSPEYISENLTEQNARSITEVISIALENKAFTSKTRTMGFNDIEEVLPIVRDEAVQRNTRSMLPSIPDTLAYVVNYANNEGFTIVSADKRMVDVLAYSEVGKYSMNNPVVKENFEDVLDDYYNHIIQHHDNRPEIKPTCVTVAPKISYSIHQNTPFDKYTKVDHPGCPVGCVPVAAATIMSHCKDKFSYHGKTYRFDDIREAIAAGPYGQGYEGNKIIGGYDPVLPEYDNAVDAMAKILYWIGQDIGVNYTRDGSSANSEDALSLFLNLGYTVYNLKYGVDNVQASLIYPATYYYNIFYESEAADRIKDNYLLYMDGFDPATNKAHAWVCDGVDYCIDPETGDKSNLYFNIDWGWGGECNGKYYGDVYSVHGINYRQFYYFAVRIDGKLKK